VQAFSVYLARRYRFAANKVATNCANYARTTTAIEISVKETAFLLFRLRLSSPLKKSLF
jgi:hypothetical protein